MKLPETGALTEGKVYTHHQQRTGGITEMCDNRSPAPQTGEGVIGNMMGTETREKPIAELAESAKVTIELLVVEREPAKISKIIELVHEAGTEAATVHFLKSDDIEVGQYTGDAVKTLYAAPVGDEMPPAFGDVVRIGAHTERRLNVVAEELQNHRLSVPSQVCPLFHARSLP
jgi:hypothetical protein